MVCIISPPYAAKTAYALAQSTAVAHSCGSMDTSLLPRDEAPGTRLNNTGPTTRALFGINDKCRVLGTIIHRHARNDDADAVLGPGIQNCLLERLLVDGIDDAHVLCPNA